MNLDFDFKELRVPKIIKMHEVILGCKDEEIYFEWIEVMKVSQIIAMHEWMLNCNDEEIHSEWLEEMPEEPREFQLDYIAQTGELYNELFDLFMRLVSIKEFRIRMSYYKDLTTDLSHITKIVFEIGKTNKFNYVEFKHVLEIAETIYADCEHEIDVQEFARMSLNEIIELEEMIQ